MSNVEIVVPKLGESVIEATITKWLKNVGDTVNLDDPLVEIATDKVDSEITATAEGVLATRLYEEGSVVAVGAPFALITTTGKETSSAVTPAVAPSHPEPAAPAPETAPLATFSPALKSPEQENGSKASEIRASGTRFYSPLVRSIAMQEGIPFAELDQIPGTGMEDRLTKNDLLAYLAKRTREPAAGKLTKPAPAASPAPAAHTGVSKPLAISGESQVVEMDRIRQLIATHMVKSVQTSPHVTSFMEADMTNIVQWREKNKEEFQRREKEKLTYTPVFIDAIARAVRDFPLVNVSVDGTKILIHKPINVGMAVALPNFNLIVPVIKNAGEKNLLGIIRSVNDLAERARKGKLQPDEISGGTISLTNLGSFGTLMGTPIINQPQTAIIAVGAIKKRVVVMETPEGDYMAIRPMMIISVTYDHRVIDGALGGQFLQRLVSHLENFDPNLPV